MLLAQIYNNVSYVITNIYIKSVSYTHLTLPTIA